MNKIFFFVILSSVLIISCIDNNEKVEKKDEITMSQFSDKPFIISKIWMRPGVTNRNSAAFMEITNNTNVDDTLFSVQSDIAKMVELHETYEKEDDMMGMRHVDYIVIPKKSTVKLKPGSFHIMLIGLNNDLKIGDSEIITINFKFNGSVQLKVEVE